MQNQLRQAQNVRRILIVLLLLFLILLLYACLLEEIFVRKYHWYKVQLRSHQKILFFFSQEAREAADKMSTESDLTELQEAVEMATLDKEMAEEKVRILFARLVFFLE